MRLVNAEEVCGVEAHNRLLDVGHVPLDEAGELGERDGGAVPLQAELAHKKVTVGLHLALGLLSGRISIRDRSGKETVTIEPRNKSAPVWAFAWNPA